MRESLYRKRLSPAKEIAYIAVACALLIGAQLALSAVAGVEIVTVIFVSFAAVFGVRRGVLCAVAFSLLRCLLFGFAPNVIVLYLAYYPILAAVFGALGHIPAHTFDTCPWYIVMGVHLLLGGLAATCAALYAFDLIRISRLWKATLIALEWVIFGLSIALIIVLDCFLYAQKRLHKSTGKGLRLIVFSSMAAVCVICFSLLDDCITPLMLGYSRSAALAYFYASFTAMLPQAVCAVVTVGFFFLPLTRILERALR